MPKWPPSITQSEDILSDNKVRVLVLLRDMEIMTPRGIVDAKRGDVMEVRTMHIYPLYSDDELEQIKGNKA